MKKLDLIGRRFAKLVVLKEHPERGNGHVQWECICDCGTKSIVQGVHLVSGHTQTCGCSRMKHLQTVNVTHGMSKTGLYHIWSSMKSRCYYKKNASCKHLKSLKHKKKIPFATSRITQCQMCQKKSSELLYLIQFT